VIRFVGDELDARALRQAFGCFPSGVTAVCGMVDGLPVGMAASSFTSVSIDPPLVSVCVANESATWQALRKLDGLGVSVLSTDHELACRQLAAKSGDRFAGLAWYATDEGAVMMEGSALHLVCTLDAELPAGDHHIALLRIRELQLSHEVPPLVFHQSAFRRLVLDVA
jgi:flavin reductase (DIM6/NTAB) family NADH-FMN oxidoreductase RutF